MTPGTYQEPASIRAEGDLVRPGVDIPIADQLAVFSAPDLTVRCRSLTCREGSTVGTEGRQRRSAGFATVAIFSPVCGIPERRFARFAAVSTRVPSGLKIAVWKQVAGLLKDKNLLP